MLNDISIQNYFKVKPKPWGKTQNYKGKTFQKKVLTSLPFLIIAVY